MKSRPAIKIVFVRARRDIEAFWTSGGEVAARTEGDGQQGEIA